MLYGHVTLCVTPFKVDLSEQAQDSRNGPSLTLHFRTPTGLACRGDSALGFSLFTRRY